MIIQNKAYTNLIILTLTLMVSSCSTQHQGQLMEYYLVYWGNDELSFVSVNDQGVVKINRVIDNKVSDEIESNLDVKELGLPLEKNTAKKTVVSIDRNKYQCYMPINKCETLSDPFALYIYKADGSPLAIKYRGMCLAIGLDSKQIPNRKIITKRLKLISEIVKNSTRQNSD